MPVFLVKPQGSSSYVAMGEGNGVKLKIGNIESFYLRAHSDPVESAFPYPSDYASGAVPVSPLYVNSEGGVDVHPGALSWKPWFETDDAHEVFEPADDEDWSKLLVFVHGIMLSVPEVKCYTASLYKRLWWEGYRGRLAAFRWTTPTTPWTSGALNTHVFSGGEYHALKSAKALKEFVEHEETLMSPGATVSILGHSLGNAVVGEALRQGLEVDNYAMMEAAVSLGAYHTNISDGIRLARLMNAESAEATPEAMSDQGYCGLFAGIQENISGNWVNYHNEVDYWLVTGKTDWMVAFKELNWIHHQADIKPNDIFGPRYYKYYVPDPAHPEGHRCVLAKMFSDDRKVTDLHEALAYVARSRTLPVGGTFSGIAVPPGVIREVDLHATYKFTDLRPHHSGQFQRDIQELYWDPANNNSFPIPLYRQMMSDLDLQTSIP